VSDVDRVSRTKHETCQQVPSSSIVARSVDQDRAAPVVAFKYDQPRSRPAASVRVCMPVPPEIVRLPDDLRPVVSFSDDR
jgi:hypothetical protein